MTNRTTRTAIGSVALLALACTIGCDNTPRAEEKKADKGKTAFDLKQAPSTKSSQAELEEARRKAGFKSNEEVMAEAKEKYERDSKVYIKERLAEYRKLLDEMRKKLDEVEKAAPKWKDAKAFESWNEKYKKDVSKIIKGYDELTKKGSEGGNTQGLLSTAVNAWEDLGRDLGAELDKEKLATSLGEIRKQIDAIAKILDEIEKDGTLVVEPPADGDAKAEGDAKADAKADEKKADAKADEKKADAKADEKKAG